MPALTLGPPTPVTIGQIEWEFSALLDVYQEKAPAKVLEIGTWEGGSLYHFLRLASPESFIVTVDRDKGDRELFESWCPYGVGLTQIVGDNHDRETIQAVKEHGPFDWLFIDGCHVYEDALQDWANYGGLCAPEAVVCFHDISLRREYEDGRVAGVRRLWRQIQAQGFLTRELRADPSFEEYGIGIVYLDRQ